MNVLKLLFLYLMVAMSSYSGAFAQSLNKTETTLVEHVEAHASEAVDLLEKVVNINSGTMNHAGVKRVGEVFEAEFQALGMATRWIELPDSLNRAGHLFAFSPGTKGKRVLLIGHLDTVFELDSPFQSWKRRGKRASGPGAADMKGGDVVILYALKALKAAGLLEDMQVVVALIGDEEKPGHPLEITRAPLIAEGQQADVVLGFETGRKGMAVVARRSSSTWRLSVKGTRAHSSGIFSERVGSGAIFEAARILNAFHEEVKGEQYLTFNAGVMLGGTELTYNEATSKGTAFGKTNVVPQAVTVDGGIRTISAEQLLRARNAMRAVVYNDNLPGTSASIQFEEGYPAMSPKPENDELLALYSQLSQDLGYEPVEAYDPGARGAADISFVGFKPALGGLGCYGSGAHATDEEVDIPSIAIATKRAALMIYRLTR